MANAGRPLVRAPWGAALGLLCALATPGMAAEWRAKGSRPASASASGAGQIVGTRSMARHENAGSASQREPVATAQGSADVRVAAHFDLTAPQTKAAVAEDESTDPPPEPVPARPVERGGAQPQYLPDDDPPPEFGATARQFAPQMNAAPAVEDGYSGDWSGGDWSEGGWAEDDGFVEGRPVFRGPLRRAWAGFNAKHNVPLEGESWRYRPYGLSGFIGGWFGDDLLDTTLQRPGLMLGGRFGWDFSPRMGGEFRGWYVNNSTTLRQTTAVPLQAHTGGFDFDFLYYPWGETQFRPYLMAGLGYVSTIYHETPTYKYNDAMLGLPFGLGVKYRLDQRFVLRSEFIDNFSFAGSRTRSMHNLSLTFGMEVRFGGGERRSYYPWSPQRNLW